MKKDRRYTINLEYCGAATQKHVVRFCGDWLGGFSTRYEAEEAVDQFKTNLEASGHIDHLKLIAETNGIQLFKGRLYTVVYGAVVNDNMDLEKALISFSNCLLHSINSNPD